MKLKPLHVNCPDCDERIALVMALAPTGETVRSLQVPNAEGGSTDALYDLSIDAAPLRAHVQERHS